MLIKEYRIPMPMSVEEYRIAQLYMIQVRPNKCRRPRGQQLWLSTTAGRPVTKHIDRSRRISGLRTYKELVGVGRLARVDSGKLPWSEEA